MKRGATILVVEDNPADSMLILGALKISGAQISLAKDGQEASDFLLRQGNFATAPRPDLIILDLNLPRRDGREVLEQIKTDPNLKSIPVVIFTSSEAKGDIAAAYRSQANSYFAKPPDLDAYYDVLDKIKQYWLQYAKLPNGHSLPVQ